MTRPFVKHLTSNLKTADGRPRNIDLGAKTLIVGPNGSGKSSIQQSLQLALIGSADDLLGRDAVRDGGLLMSMVSSDRLAIHAKLDSGEDYTFIAKEGGRPTHDSGVEASLPLHAVREVLEGSPATARKAFLGWAAEGVSPSDVADSVSAVYRAKFLDIVGNLGRGKNAVDGLLAVLEYVGKRQRDAAKEATGAEALLTGMAHDLDSAPTEEEIAAAQRMSRETQSLLLAVQDARRQEQRILANIANIREQLARPVQQAADPIEVEFYNSMAKAATIAVDRELESCPLCASPTGKSHIVNCRNFYVAAAKAQPTGPQVNRPFLQSQIYSLTQELAAIPQDILAFDTAELEQRVKESQERYLALRGQADSWSRIAKARDTVAEMTVESETYKGMKKELEGVVGGLLKRVVDTFIKRVQAFLPKGWKFDIQLEDNGKEVFRLGLLTGIKVRSALSGAEWASVTCAVAMAVATGVKADRPVLVMPEDRGWDASTLGGVLKAWDKFDGQVVIGTTTKPKTVPAGWCVIDLSKAEKAEEVEEAPVVVAPVVEVVTGYKPSPAMSAMLKALGYPEAAIASLDAEKASRIVANGIVFGGAK